MALAAGTVPLPFGLRDLRLFPLVADVAGAGVDLANIIKLTFKESVDSQDLKGDDVTKAVHDMPPTVDWELESGGIPLEALKTMNGGAIIEVGGATVTKRTYQKRAGDARPYFQIEGQSINDNGGDTHCVIWKCKATGEFTGDFTEGDFVHTGISGAGIPRGANDDLYEFIHNEAIVALSTAVTPQTRP